MISHPGGTSGPGESSQSRPEPSPPLADQSSSPQLSPYTRITRPMFSCDPIPGNVNLRAKDFHGESYYDMPTLAENPAIQRFDAVGPEVLIDAVHDSEAVLLSPGGT